MADANTATGTTADGIKVTVLIEPAPPSEEHIADIGIVFLYFLVAVVTVMCARRLLNLFNVSPTED